MEIKTIDASLFAKMFLAGAKNLEDHKEWINELNVFPVPDGDTGTNMSMTIMSAAKAVMELDNPDMATVSKAISSGSLRGARGNSGVILSQLFRGFSKGIKGYDELTVSIVSEAMQRSVETAYKAVMKPKEGTILTVARGAADKALELCDTTDDLLYFVEEVVKEADLVLSKTPDMLPVLKQAGVVDSGGQGLVQVLKGGLEVLQGKDVDLTFGEDAPVKEEPVINFTYKTTLTITLDKPMRDRELSDHKSYLESIGEAVTVSCTEETVKTELITNDPGLVLQDSLKYGSIDNVSITNLKAGKTSSKKAEAKKEEPVAEAPVTPAEPMKDMGFVSVATGDGLCQIFTELGVDNMIQGGQTMNPSTDDILNAVEKVNAKTVFVLPNNKNIVLAANQAAAISEDKKIVVIPTKTIPQGITALISFDPTASVEDNEAAMVEEIKNVKTGQVTYAVRDTEIDGHEIHKDDYMGMGDDGIISVNPDINVAFLEMIDGMVDEDSAVISIYYGEGANEESATALADQLSAKYPDLEMEVSEGGQAVYSYIASVE